MAPSPKVSGYLKSPVTSSFAEITSESQFSVLVIATSDERLQQLRRHIAKQTQKLFWFQTPSIIQQRGFWSASWLRSRGETLTPPGGMNPNAILQLLPENHFRQALLLQFLRQEL